MVKNHLEVNSTWDLVSINSNSRFESPWKAHPKKKSWKRLSILSHNHNTKIDTIQKNNDHTLHNQPNKQATSKALEEVGCVKKDVQGQASPWDP